MVRDPHAHFKAIRRGDGVRCSSHLLACSLVSLWMYGSSLNVAHGALPALLAGIKLPLLFLLTGLLCLPAYHFVALLAGSPLRVEQTVAILLSGLAMTGFLLLGLAPIVWFFVFSAPGDRLVQLFSLGVLGLAAAAGMATLVWGMILADPASHPLAPGHRRWLPALWMGLYGFVGAQLAWWLAPFGGKTVSFLAWRPAPRGSLYLQALVALSRAMPTGALVALVVVLVAGVALLGVVSLSLVRRAQWEEQRD